MVIHFKHMDSSVDYASNFDGFPMNVNVTSADAVLIKEDFSQAGFSDIKVNEVQNWVDSKIEFFITATK